MRRIYLAALSGALMLGLPGLPTYAQNVLVPQDYTAPAEPADDSGALLSTPQPTETNLPKLDPNEMSEEMSTSIPMTPMPTNTTIDQTAMTHVVKMAASEIASIPGDEGLPENIKISLKDYVWGPQDIDTVTHTLHIAPENIQKSCRLSITGMLHSDSEQGTYTFDMGATLSNVTVFYDGKPSSITIIARAMCDTVPLPPNAGMVLQVGDKYTAFIATTECPPPPPNAQTLTFKYAGNGHTDCVYK
jgi:hypothetical protein